MKNEDEVTMDILQTLEHCQDGNPCECVVTKLEAIKRLAPTREQVDEAITEFNAELVEFMPRGTNSAIEGQHMYVLLEDRLVLQCYLIGLSAGISNNRHSTRLSSSSEKRQIRCWSRPCVWLSIAGNACSYSRDRG